MFLSCQAAFSSRSDWTQQACGAGSSFTRQVTRDPPKFLSFSIGRPPGPGWVDWSIFQTGTGGRSSSMHTHFRLSTFSLPCPLIRIPPHLSHTFGHTWTCLPRLFPSLGRSSLPTSGRSLVRGLLHLSAFRLHRPARSSAQTDARSEARAQGGSIREQSKEARGQSNNRPPNNFNPHTR